MDAAMKQGVNPNYYNKVLSNYAECIRPYLRTAQELYVGAYMMAENQEFDLTAYCKEERKIVEKYKELLTSQQ